MCGIGGIIHKTSTAQDLAPVGENLVKMLEAMRHRGMDSSGVTIAGVSSEQDLIIRIWANPDGNYNERFMNVEEIVSNNGGVTKSKHSVNEYLRLGISFSGTISDLAEAIISLDGIELHSIGENSEVVKDVGSGIGLDQKHSVSSMKGTHGIGHVRMATESRVDISHAGQQQQTLLPDVFGYPDKQQLSLSFGAVFLATLSLDNYLTPNRVQL